MGRVPIGLVQLFKVGLGLLLVGEGFDHFQALDGLLNAAVDLAQGGLLLLIEAAAAPAQLFEQGHGQGQHQGGDDEQLPVDDDHHGHQAHKGEAAGQHRHHALLQGQLHVVRVVGEAAHQLAVGVAVKIGQGQVLQLVKQVPAQAVHATLGQLDHNGRLAIGGRRAEQLHGDEHQNRLAQPGKVGAARPDKVVDDAPHHIGAADVGGHGQQQKGQHGQQRQLAAGEIAQQTAHRLFQVLGLLIAPTGGAIGSRHYSPTPSC